MKQKQIILQGSFKIKSGRVLTEVDEPVQTEEELALER